MKTKVAISVVLACSLGALAPINAMSDPASGMYPDDTKVVIQDSAGQTVRTLTTGVRDGGTFDIPWDGLDARGLPVASGVYSISASARGVDGRSASVTLRAAGTVDQVELGTSGARLVIGSTRVKLSDVAAISSERKSP